MAITISPRTKVKLQAVVTLIVDIVRILVTKLLPALAGMFLSFLAGMAGAKENEGDREMARNYSCDPAEAETNPNNVFYDEYHFHDKD